MKWTHFYLLLVNLWCLIEFTMRWPWSFTPRKLLCAFALEIFEPLIWAALFGLSLIEIWGMLPFILMRFIWFFLLRFLRALIRWFAASVWRWPAVFRQARWGLFIRLLIGFPCNAVHLIHKLLSDLVDVLWRMPHPIDLLFRWQFTTTIAVAVVVVVIMLLETIETIID